MTKESLKRVMGTLLFAAFLSIATTGCPPTCEDDCAGGPDREQCVLCRDVTLILEADCVAEYCD